MSLAVSTALNVLPKLALRSSSLRVGTYRQPQGTWRTARALALTIAAPVAVFQVRKRRAKARIARQVGPGGRGVPVTIWDELDLPVGCSKAEIRSGFKRYVRKNHPDVTGDTSDFARERWTVITEAYKEIMKVGDDMYWLMTWDAKVESTQKMKKDAFFRWQEMRALERYQRRKAEQAVTAAKVVIVEDLEVNTKVEGKSSDSEVQAEVEVKVQAPRQPPPFPFSHVPPAPSRKTAAAAPPKWLIKKQPRQKEGEPSGDEDARKSDAEGTCTVQ